MSKALGTGFLSSLDRVAGALVGAAQAILILWLAGGVIASGPFPTLSKIAQQSTALRVVDAFLPPPTEIVLELGNLLDDSGLPERLHRPRAAPGAGDRSAIRRAGGPDRRTGGAIGAARRRRRLRPAGQRLVLRHRARSTS